MARSRANSDKLTRMLRRMPAEIKDGLKAPIAAYAEKVLQGARGRVPVKTGKLRRNITKRIAKDGLTARVGILTKKGRQAAWYAHFVEFGTAPHDLNKGARRHNPKARRKGVIIGNEKPKRHPGARARPFLFPAAEAAKGPFITEMNVAVGRALEKAAK